MRTSTTPNEPRLVDVPPSLPEVAMANSVDIQAIFRAVHEFMRARRGLVLFGAHAVNTYCRPARNTMDIDVMAPNAEAVAEELREYLAKRFFLAVRVRRIRDGFRVYQVMQPENRHLVDLRESDTRIETRMVEGIAVVTPPFLVAMKVKSFADRRMKQKGLSDRQDLERLLSCHASLRRDDGPVAEALFRWGRADLLPLWREIVANAYEVDDEDE